MTMSIGIGRQLLLLSLFIVFPLNLQAADRATDTAPRTRSDGGPWRIGYMEGGPYYDYQASLLSMFKGLQALGWLAKGPIPVPEDPQDTRKIWAWARQGAAAAPI